MRRMSALAALLVLCATPQAFALGADSTMADWQAASVADRDALLNALGPQLSRSFGAERAEILACMNRAGESDAHAALPIRQIAKACAEAAEPDRNTGSSTDI